MMLQEAGGGGGGCGGVGEVSSLHSIINAKVKLSLDGREAHQLMDEASPVGVAFSPGSGSL